MANTSANRQSKLAIGQWQSAITIAESAIGNGLMANRQSGNRLMANRQSEIDNSQWLSVVDCSIAESVDCRLPIADSIYPMSIDHFRFQLPIADVFAIADCRFQIAD
jgi:hypothetical protein